MMVTSLSVCPNSEQGAEEFGMMVTSLSVYPNSEQEAAELGMMVTDLSYQRTSGRGVRNDSHKVVSQS